MTLTKEKRDQCILALLLIGGALSGLYFGVIRSQAGNLEELKKNLANTKKKIADIENSAKSSAEIAANLLSASNVLWRAEADMFSGDSVASAYGMIQRFSANYRVDIPTIGSVSGSTDVNMFPAGKFPYKQMTVT